MALVIVILTTPSCGASFEGLVCDAPLLICEDICVDPTADPGNCGGCGTTCGPLERCADSGCSAFCGPGSTLCDNTCVETDFNPVNCGGCGISCSDGEVCSLGTCAERCGGGTSLCFDRCADVLNDRNACGQCDRRCASGELCFEGECLTQCPSDLAQCDGHCVDARWDPSHCGGCNAACAPEEFCTDGTCADTCTGGASNCDGRCVALASDKLHCGACLNSCAPSEVCTEGQCSVDCSAGLTDCSSDCVDTAFDRSHCGQCDTPCAGAQECWRSRCLTPRFDGTVADAFEQLPMRDLADLPSISEFTPAGRVGLYIGRGLTFLYYDATGAQWIDLLNSGFESPRLASFAWSSDDLFLAGDGQLHEFNPIAGMSASSPAFRSAPGTQIAHDDDGNLFYMSHLGGVVRVDGASRLNSVDTSQRLAVTMPRVAFDSLTQRVYLVPRFDTNLIFEYDPLTSTFIAIPRPPVTTIEGAFCTDRSGHLYIRGALGQVWQFTAWTQEWKQVADTPFSLHPGAVCTATADGWLYFYRSPWLARLRLF